SLESATPVAITEIECDILAAKLHLTDPAARQCGDIAFQDRVAVKDAVAGRSSVGPRGLERLDARPDDAGPHRERDAGGKAEADADGQGAGPGRPLNGGGGTTTLDDDIAHRRAGSRCGDTNVPGFACQESHSQSGIAL